MESRELSILDENKNGTLSSLTNSYFEEELLGNMESRELSILDET
jgi:hypothetical protein